MAILDNLQAFDIDNSTLSLWVFKKSAVAGQPPRIKGRWIETIDGLEVVLKQTLYDERNRIEEVHEYDLLAQNNEASALEITTLETHADLVLAQSAAELSSKKVAQIKDIKNSDFYLIKLVCGDSAIHAVSKADASWRTKKSFTKISAFFADEQLGLEDKVSIDLSKKVDFFIVGDGILINNKGRFESILNYKQAHKDDFIALQAESHFMAIFSDLAPLAGHVGENKIQLRRVSGYQAERPL